MTGHGAKFGRKEEEGIAALLTQPNIEEAARSIDVALKTLLRWLQVPQFQKTYRQAPSDAFGQAVVRLQQGTTAAATTLLKTMIDPGTHDPPKPLANVAPTMMPPVFALSLFDRSFG
jgi:hypothetical protein